MTDMRATERLLEVIEEKVKEAAQAKGPMNLGVALIHIRDAATELRRRGDTLVRADDLLLVVQEVDGWLKERFGQHYRTSTVDHHEEYAQAIDRLENALGGKVP